KTACLINYCGMLARFLAIITSPAEIGISRHLQQTIQLVLKTFLSTNDVEIMVLDQGLDVFLSIGPRIQAVTWGIHAEVVGSYRDGGILDFLFSTGQSGGEKNQ